MRAQDIAKIHEFKVWPAYFVRLESDEKTFELRDMTDREPVNVGDCLHLREWDEAAQAYTGRELWKGVTYVMKGGTFGLPDHLQIFGLRPGK